MLFCLFLFAPVILNTEPKLEMILIFRRTGEETFIPAYNFLATALKNIVVEISKLIVAARDFLSEIRTVFVIASILGVYALFFYPNEVKGTFSDAFQPIFGAISEVKLAVKTVYSDLTNKVTIQLVAQLGLIVALIISFPVLISEVVKVMLKGIK